MPNPNDYDDKDVFISACMSHSDNRNLDRAARYAKCMGMWESRNKKAKAEESIESGNTNNDREEDL